MSAYKCKEAWGPFRTPEHPCIKGAGYDSPSRQEKISPGEKSTSHKHCLVLWEENDSGWLLK